jgi:hypothetical protein
MCVELTSELILKYETLSLMLNKHKNYYLEKYYEIYGFSKSSKSYISSNVVIESGYCVPSMIMSYSDIASVPEVLCPGADYGIIGFGTPY